MDPPRVKLYGLFPLTRRRYVVQVAVALVLAAAVLVAWWLFRASVRQQFEGADDANVRLFVAFWDVLPYIIAGVVALQVVEAFVVLRLFRTKEAAPQAQPPAPG